MFSSVFGFEPKIAETPVAMHVIAVSRPTIAVSAATPHSHRGVTSLGMRTTKIMQMVKARVPALEIIPQTAGSQ